MEAVGIKPPTFFYGITRHRPTTWDAEHWVQENLTPGPAGTAVNRVLREIERAAKSVERAQELVNKLNN